MRVLMARQAREWRFDLDEGVLDGSRLARARREPRRSATVQGGKRLAVSEHGRHAC